MRKLLVMVRRQAKSVTDARVVSLVLLLVVGLMALSSSRSVLAQEEEIGLTLRLVPYRYRNEITVGEGNIFFLEIGNRRDKAITNLRLSSVAPEGWVIDFKSGEIDYLAPGNIQTVDVNIKPSVGTVKGDYKVTLIAESNESRRVLVIWTTVKTLGRVWLWVGGTLLFLVVAAFIIIYVRFGRHS